MLMTLAHFFTSETTLICAQMVNNTFGQLIYWSYENSEQIKKLKTKLSAWIVSST